MATMNLKAPSFLVTAGESLTPLEFARLMACAPKLLMQKRGKGQPVIVLPGLGASNVSTLIMRNYLSWLGYEVRGWTLGRNNGDVGAMLPTLSEQLKQTYSEHRQKVTIIGWSLGGVLARELARDFPQYIRQIVTMGSPVVGGPKYTSFARLYHEQGADLDAIEARIAERERRSIRVPITSIFSKRDGIVSWQASIDKRNTQADNIEVGATHLGLGISPDVFMILARKLAST